MQITLAKHNDKIAGKTVFMIDESLKLSPALEKLNKNKTVTDLLTAHPHFKGKKGQVISGLIGGELLILLGLGKDINALSIEQAVGKLTVYLNNIECQEVSLFVDTFPKTKLSEEEMVEHLTIGLLLRNYRFHRYYVNKAKDHKIYLHKLELQVSSVEKNKNILSAAESLAHAVCFTKDLVSTPGNDLYPETFVEHCQALSKLGVKIKVLNEDQMRKLGMNALLGVGQGSDKDSYCVVMEYFGAADKKQAPIALIGKGVTFDTGGISIKPSANMGDMKYDMAGAGAVVGAMYAIASRKAKTNVIAAVGLVENMPSGSAQRPGDVVKSMSGQTIEIDNTDAEGRLVLADVLWYIQDKYNPLCMIDLATLTGAMVIALGENYTAGLFSNDDDLACRLHNAGEVTNDRVWRLPMADHYDNMINSEIADVKNTGNGRGAGSITAAQFLKRFVNNKPWAHIDIAGMAWDKNGSDLHHKGATGYGVRLLNALVQSYENN